MIGLFRSFLVLLIVLSGMATETVGSVRSAERIPYSTVPWTDLSTPNLPLWELESLFKLFIATQGHNWLWRPLLFGARWNFTADPNPCVQRWQGINCTFNASTEDYHVVALALPGYNMKGILPTDIVDMSELTQLTLSSNKLYGNLPVDIDNLTELVGLSLFGNQLSGPIPDSIGNLANLQQLLIYDNRLSGQIPETIGELAQLRTFSAYYNHLSGTLPESIGQLTNLVTLNLNSNHLQRTIPESIGNLQQLSVLDLDNCAFTGPLPESIGNLSSLRKLLLYDNALTGTLPRTIGGMTQLTDLEVQYNQLEGVIPEEITQLQQLNSLDLYANAFHGTMPNALGNLTGLLYLGLDINKLSGTIPESIGNCTKLLRLYLNQNHLTGTIPDSFRNLRLLQYMNVYVNQLTGTIPDFLGELRLLTNLGLDENQFHGSVPAALGNLTLMRSFYININQLTGTVPDTLANMHQVQGLFMASNHLSGPLPPFLTSLTKLRNIEIGNNRFTGTIPQDLGALTDLQYLYMDSLLLSGTIPASLGNLHKLQFISLSGNMLSGTLPKELAGLTQLREILCERNKLGGNLNSLFSPAQASLETILLADNRLTGTLPSGLFRLPRLNTVVFISNCFHGELPGSICNATNMRSLVLDGMSSAHACRNPVLPHSSAYMIDRSVQGTVPGCLFTLPRLNTLHMSGNGFTGTLPELTEFSAALIDVSLSHNILSGTIPSAMQRRQWYNLDLAYNRLTGQLVSDFASEPVRADSDDDVLAHRAAGLNFTIEFSLSLENNLLSGRVPASLKQLQQVSILGSNIFTCELDHSDLPVHDHNRGSYECGSTAFNVPYYVWLAVIGTSVTALALAWLLYANNQTVGGVASLVHKRILSVKQYMEFAYTHRVGKSQLNVFNHVVEVICRVTLYAIAYILLILLPVYAYLSSRYGVMTHLYAYAVSGAFLSGIVPMAVEMPLLLLMVALMLILFAKLIGPRLKHEAQQRRRRSYVTPHVHKFWSVTSTKALIIFIYLVFDLIIVAGFNVAYVYIAIYENSAYHVFAQIALSLFKVVWNNLCISIVLRTIVQLITTESFTARDSKYSENEFMSVQVFVALLNNIAVPCLVVAVVSPSCFYNVFVRAPTVQSVFTYTYCSVFNADTGDCTTYLPHRDSSEYNPPFTYNFNCSFSLISYYSPAFVSLCLITAFVAPVTQLILQYLHARARRGTAWFRLLDLVCPRILKPLDDSDAWSAGPIAQTASAKDTVASPLPSAADTTGVVSSPRLMSDDTESGKSTTSTGTQGSTTSVRRVLSMATMSLARAATLSGSQTVSNYEQTYFKANQVLISLLTYLGLLLTFGTMFPPLAAAMALTVLLCAAFARYKVGRFLTKAVEQKLFQYVDLVEVECQGVSSISVLQRAMWMLITASCWFYTPFLFDTLGHRVGFEGAYWVLIVMPLMPALLYTGFRWYRWNVQRARQVKGDDDVELGMEMQVSVNTMSSTAAIAVAAAVKELSVRARPSAEDPESSVGNPMLVDTVVVNGRDVGGHDGGEEAATIPQRLASTGEEGRSVGDSDHPATADSSDPRTEDGSAGTEGGSSGNSAGMSPTSSGQISAVESPVAGSAKPSDTALGTGKSSAPAVGDHKGGSSTRVGADDISTSTSASCGVSVSVGAVEAVGLVPRVGDEEGRPSALYMV